MTQRDKWVKPAAKRYLEYKDKVAWEAKVMGIKPLDGWVEVRAKFYFRNNKLPDLDNLVKSILDALNSIAWKDDKQVVKIVAERLRADDEWTEVEIKEVF